MNAISGWIMSILGIIILGVILDLLLSGSKIHRLIQTVFATVTILVIITPLPSLIKGGFRLESSIFQSTIDLDNRYLDYMSRSLTASMERGLVEALAGDGIKNVEVSIVAEFLEQIVVREVKINAANVVIDQNYLHINKYEYIKDKVSEYLKVSKGVIVVYG